MQTTGRGEPFHRWDPKKHRIRDLPNADRPREKLIRNGAASLSDVELLAVLLGSGSRRAGVLDLASRILRSLGGRLDSGNLELLQSIPGVGDAKACQIEAAFELTRRHIAKGRHVIREAMDALAETDFRNVEPEPLAAYARFLRERGRDDEAEVIERRLDALLQPESAARII